MVFNIISLVMSVMALAASTWGVSRQIGRARADSDLVMTTEVLLTHIRDPEFQRDQRWVLFELAAQHSPDQGIVDTSLGQLAQRPSLFHNAQDRRVRSSLEDLWTTRQPGP